MGNATQIHTATHNGQTFTRTSRTRTYTHVIVGTAADGSDAWAIQWTAATGAKLTALVAGLRAKSAANRQRLDLPQGVQIDAVPASVQVQQTASRKAWRVQLVGGYATRWHGQQESRWACELGRVRTFATREAAVRAIEAAMGTTIAGDASLHGAAGHQQRTTQLPAEWCVRGGYVSTGQAVAEYVGDRPPVVAIDADSDDARTACTVRLADADGNLQVIGHVRPSRGTAWAGTDSSRTWEGTQLVLPDGREVWAMATNRQTLIGDALLRAQCPTLAAAADHRMAD